MERDFNRNTYVLHEDEKKGAVVVSDEVICIIAGLAATEVKGVAAMAGNITNELMSKVGRKNLKQCFHSTPWADLSLSSFINLERFFIEGRLKDTCLRLWCG